MRADGPSRPALLFSNERTVGAALARQSDKDCSWRAQGVAGWAARELVPALQLLVQGPSSSLRIGALIGQTLPQPEPCDRVRLNDPGHANNVTAGARRCRRGE